MILESDLILEKHAAFVLCTLDMVDIEAADLEAPYSGALFMTHGTLHGQATLGCHVHVHQSAVQGLVHLVRPQATVEVHPFVDVHVEQSSRPVRGPVAGLMTEKTSTCVFWHGEWANRDF